MRILATTLAVLALHPLAARAQTAGAALPRMDTSASIGWFMANHTESSECCNSNWSSSLFKGVSGGYYWTDHLKSEVEIAWPGPTRAYTYSNSTVRPPGGTPSYTQEEHVYQGVKLSLGQSYQFGRNSIFHPFAGAGVDIDREDDAITRTALAGSAFPRVERLNETEVHTRPFVTTGFKAYFSERAFFRTEFKVSFTRQVEQTMWKSGIGVDLGPAARRRAAPARARQPDTPRGQDSPDVWRAYAARLPVGSVVRVAHAHQDGFVASLLAVDDRGILLKPRTRIPEPARHVPFAALERLELFTHDGPGERAGAIVAGVGAASGAFFLLLLALVSQFE